MFFFLFHAQSMLFVRPPVHILHARPCSPARPPAHVHTYMSMLVHMFEQREFMSIYIFDACTRDIISLFIYRAYIYICSSRLFLLPVHIISAREQSSFSMPVHSYMKEEQSSTPLFEQSKEKRPRPAHICKKPI